MKDEKEVKKPKSKLRKILEWIATSIIGILFAFASICNVAKLLTAPDHYGNGNAFGFSNYVVLTDSMEPVYPVDSVIIAYLDKPQEIVNKWNEIKDLNLDPTDERCINLTFFDGYNKRVNSPIADYNNQTENTGSVMTHQLFAIIVDEGIEEGQGRYTFFVHGINISEHQSGIGQYQVFTEKELLGVVKTNSKFLGAISGFISSVWGLFILLLVPCLYLVISSVLDIVKAAKSEEDEEATEGATSNGGTSTANLSDKDYEALKQQMIDEMLNGKKGDKK